MILRLDSEETCRQDVMPLPSCDSCFQLCLLWTRFSMFQMGRSKR